MILKHCATDMNLLWHVWRVGIYLELVYTRIQVLNLFAAKCGAESSQAIHCMLMELQKQVLFFHGIPKSQCWVMVFRLDFDISPENVTEYTA